MKRTTALGIVSILLLFWSPAFGQEHREKDYETVMTKGTFAVENGDYKAAVEYFQKALDMKPKDKIAALSLGIAWSRDGDFTKAADALRAALSMDPSNPRIRYELAIVLYKRGETVAAKEHFTAIAEASVDVELRSAAKTYLDRIAAREGGKKLSLNFQLGAQYDSNVILDPKNPVVPAREKKSDSRAVATFDGKYSFVNRDIFTASAGYQFYQSVHANLEDFNVQQHSMSLAARSSFKEKFAAGLTYTFSYTGVGGEHYSTIHAVRPAVDMKLSPQSLTGFHLGYEDRRFLNNNDEIFPANADRTGTNASAGLTHTVMLTKETGVALGYTFDKDDADVNVWDATGHKGSLQLQSDLRIFTAFATAAFTDRKYDEASSPLLPKRHDQTQEYGAGVSRNLTGKLRLVLSDFYTFNDSNLSPYEYTRNIIGLFAEMGI